MTIRKVYIILSFYLNLNILRKKIYIYQIVSEVFIDERHKFSVQNIILVLTNFLKSHGQTVSRFDDLDDKTPR